MTAREAPVSPRPRLWRVTQPVALAVAATPAETMQALVQATQPHQSRLQHRDLYVGGRRYYLRARPDGFELRSDSKTFWNRKRRTARAAIVDATLGQTGDVTTLRLMGRLRVPHLVLSLLFPSWMALLVAAAPWPVELTLVVVTALYGFSLVGIHYDAALQAQEMIYFVRKALEDLPAAVIGELTPGREEVVAPTARGFDDEWRRFYHQHSGPNETA